MKSHTIFFVLVVGLLTVNLAKAEDNVHFSGALVAEPCTLPETDTDIHVDFGSVIVKYLYQYQRTKSQPFTIHLEDCDPSVMSTVSVTFEGSADDELTDFLALDAVSSARGVAIGFEHADGSLIAINQSGGIQQIIPGNNELIFKAFIQAKPSHINEGKIIVGEFNASSNFKLDYQ